MAFPQWHVLARSLALALFSEAISPFVTHRVFLMRLRILCHFLFFFFTNASRGKCKNK